MRNKKNRGVKLTSRESWSNFLKGLSAFGFFAIMTVKKFKRTLFGEDAPVSVIYYNGQIVTMEGNSEEEMLANAPDAVLIEDGKIRATGKLSVLEEMNQDAEQIDLGGKCLMPAFIDAHSHFVMNGQMSLCADLSECECFEDIISVLQEFIAAHKITKDQAVMGFGYDHNFLKESASLIREYWI